MMRRIVLSSVLVLVGVMGLAVAPATAGSPISIGSLVGSKNATLDGQAPLPNTTVWSGDRLLVNNGFAMVALDQGNRMILGRGTEASFSREADGVTVSLTRGNMSLYHPQSSQGLRVRVSDLTVAPVQGYKTLGEVAMADGWVVVTAKQGTLQVEHQGRTEQVAEGKTVTLPVKTARAPVPNPPAPPSSNAHITTATTLGVLGLGAGSAAAVLAGIGILRSNDAKSAANAATTAANNATSAANAATAAANSAGEAANAAGCAENVENARENPGTPSPYMPPSGYSCP